MRDSSSILYYFFWKSSDILACSSALEDEISVSTYSRNFLSFRAFISWSWLLLPPPPPPVKTAFFRATSFSSSFFYMAAKLASCTCFKVCSVHFLISSTYILVSTSPFLNSSLSAATCYSTSAACFFLSIRYYCSFSICSALTLSMSSFTRFSTSKVNELARPSSSISLSCFEVRSFSETWKQARSIC